MSKVQDFIYNFEGTQKELLQFLHELLMSFPEVTNKIRFKIPFYYRKSWICYLNPKKNGSVELAFTRGNELSNEQGLLDAKNRKQVSGIDFFSIKDIPLETLNEIIQEALVLDEMIPYASKNKKT